MPFGAGWQLRERRCLAGRWRVLWGRRMPPICTSARPDTWRPLCGVCPQGRRRSNVHQRGNSVIVPSPVSDSRLRAGAGAYPGRQRFLGITDNAQARECARTIAGWKPLAHLIHRMAGIWLVAWNRGKSSGTGAFSPAVNSSPCTFSTSCAAATRLFRAKPSRA